MTMALNRNKVTIIGAGLSGLFSAQVLAGHFQLVTLVEKDKDLDQSRGRKFTPQAHHVHTMMKGGENLLFGLFPDLKDVLVKSGVPELELGQDYAFYGLNGFLPRYHSGIFSRMCSRTFLE